MNNLPLIAIGMLFASIIVFKAVQNKDPSKLMFSENYALQIPAYDGLLHVVTWNIAYGEKIKTAIEMLTKNEALQGVDILLLQEMDELGTDLIAQALNYNYVYFSATIYPHSGKNYGNAILSPWPLSEGTRVALPHRDPFIGQERIAVRAVVTINEEEVLVYSTHTETIRLGWGKRLAQLEYLALDVVSQQSRHVVVGGDFNIPTIIGIRLLTEHMAEYDLIRVSKGTGPTFKKRAFRYWDLDHIFANGLSLVANGVVSDTSASDHFPLWVHLTLE